jgi:hypothetical protein
MLKSGRYSQYLTERIAREEHFTDFHPDPKAATKGGSLTGNFPVQTLNAKRCLPCF